MVKRRVPTRTSGDGGYTVGYCKPPTKSRFQPGQSGNPAGRQKGVRNLTTDVKRTLMTPVRVKEAGRVRNRSTQESLLLVLREKALKGDARALDRLLELAQRFNNDSVEPGLARPLAADDLAILAAYVDERTGTRTTPPPAPADRVEKKRRRSLPKRSEP